VILNERIVSSPLLSLRDLSVAFGRDERKVLAVDRVSFDIDKGETVALVGESGSGKSVTALSVMQLLPYPAAWHPSGAIMFKGRDLMGLREREMRQVRGKDITIVFQEPMTSLNPLHVIEKQIGEILALHGGLTGSAARTRIVELLGQVGIRDPESRLQSFPHQLSGGQRQRVAIARALILEPRILLLDEPTSALDVSVQAEILNLLARLRRQHRLTLLMVSHDLAVIAHLCERIGVMSNGNLIEITTAEALSRGTVTHPYTQELLRSNRGFDRSGAEIVEAAS